MTVTETVLDVLEPRLLLEMAWEKLVNFIADEVNLIENLEALYELEYKYSMLRARPFEGVPQRRERMLERLEKVAYDLAATIADQINDVYGEWLGSHAIGNPAEWAAARVSDAEDREYGEIESGEDLYGAMQEAWNEYDRYVHYGGGSAPYSYAGSRPGVRGPETDEVAQALREGKLPSLLELASVMMQEENENMADEEDFQPYDDPADYLESILDAYGSLLELVKGVDWNYVDASPRALLEELYEAFVFPVWWGHWKAQGIEDTRERIADASKLLSAITTNAEQFPVQELLGKLNEIVSLTHQSGDMMEYLEGRYQISTDDLQALSDRDTSDWDEELQELGVQMNGPDPQGDAEAAERAGPAPA